MFCPPDVTITIQGHPESVASFLRAMRLEPTSYSCPWPDPDGRDAEKPEYPDRPPFRQIEKK